MANLRATLTRIYTENGKLTPQNVVDDARPEESELHGRFEWDDSVAGEQYRLVQARRLITSVRIEYSEDTDEDGAERRFVRAFSSVRQTVDPEQRGYKPTEEIMSDPLAAKILLRECQRAITDLKRKYGHLAEFGELVRNEFGEAAS